MLEEFLSRNTSLVTLNLSMNSVGKHGTRFIANGLAKNTNLRVLHLDHNEVRSAGAHFLAAVLKRPECLLEELSLFCNVSTSSSCIRYIQDSQIHAYICS